VIQVLQKSDQPLSRTQIAEELGITPRKVSLIIRVLLRFGEVECVELDRFKSAEILGWKNPWRRTRFYYCSSK
jgi:predicted ArsR family transcriptional regulator